MSTVLLLMNLKDQGLRAAKDIPARIQEGIKAFEAMGGKMLGFHATMGPYDYVAVGEVPNDEVGVAFALALAARGNIRTLSMKAFSRKKIGGIVAKLT